LEQLLRNQDNGEGQTIPGPRRCLDRLHQKRQYAWEQFFADRGHALADVIDGQGDGVALSSAHAMGRRLSLNIGLPAIEEAQAQLT